jgi:hypothetical protein
LEESLAIGRIEIKMISIVDHPWNIKWKRPVKNEAVLCPLHWEAVGNFIRNRQRRAGIIKTATE